MSSVPRTVVIVGAGFSGTVVAINLLRLTKDRALRVVLVDRDPMARGVAYAKRPYPYLLNVPAGRMSATSSEPLEFLEFAQRRLPNAAGDDFLPRELYGDYLESLLADAELASSSRVQLDRIRGAVCAIERVHRSSRLHVHLADGRKLSADTVVLALGNPAPARLPGAEALRDSSRYVADPWKAPAAVRAGETVLIAGTGLTMVDIALAANTAAKGRAVIHAISRHGLIPLPQAAFRHVHDVRDSRLIAPGFISIRHLLRTVRELSESAALRGGDWREVIGLVRTHAPAIWQRLSVRERRRFLRHARCYWDVHRHRLPESTWCVIDGLRRTDRLHVHAGRIGHLLPAGNQIRVSWRARGEDSARMLLVDRVINCMGPDYDVCRTQDRLLRSLIAQGMAVPDPLGLGLMTEESGVLMSPGGRGTAGSIYYIGPMLRAGHWETTAVQELRVHAERLAFHLASPSRAWRVHEPTVPALGG